MSTDDLRAIRDEIGIMPSPLDLAASMRRLIDALIDEQEGGATECKPTPGLLAESGGNASAPAATSSGLGDALRQAAEVDPPTLYAALPDLAAQADALESERVAAWDEGYGAADKVTSVMISTVRQVEAERDRLADERDTLRTALDQERRSMANRLAVLERIKGERDVAWAAVGRVRAALARWTGTPGAYTDHGSALARAWKSAAIDIEAALDGDESQPCDSGAGAEGSRTRETGAWTDEQGGSGMSGGSGAAGASEGENGGCVFAMRGRRG